MKRILVLLIILVFANIKFSFSQNFEKLGQGLNEFSGEVNSLTIHNGDLYAGGKFLRSNSDYIFSLGRWDGKKWISLGGGAKIYTNGTNNVSTVNEIVSYNNSIIIYGDFNSVGDNNISVSKLARWDGTNWSAFGGTNFSGTINCMKVYNNELYIAGLFSNINGVLVSNIAKYDGSVWTTLGLGTNGVINDLEWFNNELYIGGTFTTAGGNQVKNIAKWNGTNWTSIGSGINGTVGIIKKYNNSLIFTGSFTSANGESAKNIVNYNGTIWKSYGAGLTTVEQLSIYKNNIYAGRFYKWDSVNHVWNKFDEEINSSINTTITYNDKLIIAGKFTQIDAKDVNYITYYDGSNIIGSGNGVDLNPTWMNIYDNKLYVGGAFTTAGGVPANRSASWDGQNWSNGAVIPEVSNIKASCVFNNELYLGGSFTTANSQNIARILKWNGTNFNSIGLGINPNEAFNINFIVNAIEGYKGELFAAGKFTVAGTNLVSNIAKWDGQNWTSPTTGIDGTIYCMKVFNNELYVGGSFSSAGGVEARNIAKWDGQNWSPVLINGTPALFDGAIRSIEIYNNKLYVSGEFTKVNNVNFNKIAMWDGQNWAALQGGLSGGVLAYKLLTHKNGLYVCGDFTSVNGVNSKGFGKWNGSNWVTYGVGMNGTVANMLEFNNTLYISGSFTSANGIAANNIVMLFDTTSTNTYTPNQKVFDFKIYPNPVSNILYFQTNIEAIINKRVIIFNLEGRVLYDNEIEGTSIDLNFLDDGIYIIQINNISNVFVFRK